MSTTCSAPHSHPVDAVTPPHSAAAVAGHVTPLPSALCFPWPAQRAAELRSAKMALRRSIKRSLAALSAEDVDAQSARATDRLLSDAGPTSSAVWECPAFAVYLSMASGELRTEPLLRWIFARGRRVFVPVVRSATEMDLLEAHSMEDIAAFPISAWGIPEPPDDFCGRRRTSLLDADADVVALTHVAVLPGVAFDRSGARLGHGRGYYDRFLHRWEAARRARGLSGSARYIALALECQLLEHIPAAHHDVPLHAVVGPRGHHVAPAAAAATALHSANA